MLESIVIRGFKSLVDVKVERLPRLAVFFGPNAAGKSNLIDAVQLLSRLASSRTIQDAMSPPLRGYPIEAFSFPQGGLPQLLQQSTAKFELDAVLRVGKDRFQYRVSIRIIPATGALVLEDEYLASLSKTGAIKGNATIERVDEQFRIRRKSKPAHPRQEKTGLNHTLVSDTRFSGNEYRAIERCRTEMSGWRTYYLDPRVAMREAHPPAAVQDIGPLGESVAAYLYRLKSEEPRRFAAVTRTLRAIIPSVENLSVDLDERRGTLDISVRQNGVDFSSRIISEGTLRVLALSAMAVNPWGGSLLAFEEPENGVHPRRLELIADLLLSLCEEGGVQLLIATHSPLLCNAMLRRAQSDPSLVQLFQVRQSPIGTSIDTFDAAGPLFSNQEIAEALTSQREDGLFERLLLRGLLNE